MTLRKQILFAGWFLGLALSVHAQTPPAPAADEAAGKVVVSGTVPDEAARAALLGKVRDLYGAANVVDRLEVGGVVPPPNWTDNVGKLLTANLKQVHKGRLQITGTQVAVKGNVGNEAQRQQVVSEMATALNQTYTIDNGLIVAGSAQGNLDKVLANRVVEFETASAKLTAAGRGILDEMSEAIKKLGNPKVQLIGHTDSDGNRAANVALSLERANSVRDYLVGKGIPAASLTTSGVGPDRPATSNATPEGRAKNRRIEFHLLN